MGYMGQGHEASGVAEGINQGQETKAAPSH